MQGLCLLISLVQDGTFHRNLVAGWFMLLDPFIFYLNGWVQLDYLIDDIFEILGFEVVKHYLLILITLLAEPSPLHTTTIVEKYTLKLVDEYKHMLCQATEPMSTFLEYITYVIFAFFLT